MKKFFGLLSLIIVLALGLTFSMPLASIAVASAVTDTSSYKAPAQSANPFNSEIVSVGEISTWESKNESAYLINETITSSNIDDFKQKNPTAYSMPDSDISGREAVYVSSSNNQPASIAYSSPEILLQANAHYQISLSYYAIENTSYFYIGEKEISLIPTGDWETATFFIKTDSLENTTIIAELFLGSRTQMIKGSVYFDNFKVNAIRETDYNKETTPLDSGELTIDLTLSEYKKLEKTFTSSDFTPAPNTSSSINKVEVNSTTIANTLEFEESTPIVYTQNGTTSNDLILLAANNSISSVTLDSSVYSFEPRQHEIYMFQFYSIASMNETGSLYLRVGDTYHEVITIDYKYHNGWQLNTIFYIGDHTTYEEGLEIGFNVGYTDNTADGWASIEGLTINRVSGEYYETNSAAFGVHDTMDLRDPNSSASDGTDTTTIANSNFNLGIASDINSPTYPYPLKASGSWESNKETSGIINTKEYKASSITATIPGYEINNNIFMLKNIDSQYTELKSQTISFTFSAESNQTNITFDAYGDIESNKNAVAVLKLEDKVLGEIQIENGRWRSYSFEIKGNEFISSASSFNLFITTQTNGAAYIDNVEQHTVKQTDIKEVIDLTNHILIPSTWENEDLEFSVRAEENGIEINNQGGQYITVENNIGYTVTPSSYYKMTIMAYGEQAFIGLKDFDGVIELVKNTDEHTPTLAQEYILYFYTGETIATEDETEDTTNNEAKSSIVFSVDLGDSTEGALVFGSIFIEDIKIENIEQDAYALAESAASDSSMIKILTPTAVIEEEVEEETPTDDSDFFANNWWYLVPSIITALAIIMAIFAFLLRRSKFNKYITSKGTSYAKDVKIQSTRNKIVADKSVKVDNIIDDSEQN